MFVRDIVARTASESHCLHAEARLSFSQFGEDLVIASVLQSRKHLENGFYIDVGAFDPFRYSNTALLHLFRGWHGINIDASQEAIDRFRLHRPNDINIHSAVSDTEGDAEFFMFNHGAVNTLDPAMVARYAGTQGSPFVVKQRATVQTRRLDRILGEVSGLPSQVGLLSVDCEGLDHRILASMDWSRVRPLVVAVECHGMDLSRVEQNPTHCLLAAQGYRLVSHVFVTSIYCAG